VESAKGLSGSEKKMKNGLNAEKSSVGGLNLDGSLKRGIREELKKSL